MSASLPDLSSWECSSSGGLFRLLPWGLVPLPPGGLVTMAARVAAVEVLAVLRQLALTSPTRSAGRRCRRPRRSVLSA